MSQHKGERVGFHVRMPVDLWRELKHRAVDGRTSLGDQVVQAVERYLAEERAREEKEQARKQQPAE